VRKLPKRPKVLVFQKRPAREPTWEVNDAAAEGQKVRDCLSERRREGRHTHEAAMVQLRQLLGGCNVDAQYVFLDDEVEAEGFDLVVALGGDGTVLHASHHIGHTPVLAINSAPQYSVGFLTAATMEQAPEMVEQALAGTLSVTRLERMAVEIEGRRVYDRVLNDVLFSHACPASTARYVLELDGVAEEQCSSGIWVGPAAGSTAALRAAGGRVLPPGSKKFQFIVREPYQRDGVTYQLIKGLVPTGGRLVLRSMISEARLYVDGPHVELPIHLGESVTFTLSDHPLRLLGFRRRSTTANGARPRRPKTCQG
jgi:NAD+ kinase